MCLACGCVEVEELDLRLAEMEPIKPDSIEQLIDDPLEETIRSYEKLYRRTRELDRVLERY